MNICGLPKSTPGLNGKWQEEKMPDTPKPEWSNDLDWPIDNKIINLKKKYSTPGQKHSKR